MELLHGGVSRFARDALCVGAAAVAIALALSPSAHAASPTVVSLTFDDTLANQYQTRSMLAAHGMHATYYVNSPRIDTSGYLTKAQLLGLQSDGNEIAGHTVSHLDLSTVDVDFGGLSGAAETVPPADPYAIKTVDGVLSSDTLADLENDVTRAENAGGGWVIFVFHNVCDGCSSLAVSPSTLSTFLGWLAPRASGGTSVETVRQVIGGDVKPAVPGPPPPGVRSGNMLLNPSLEGDTDGNGFPDCWRPNSWRVNSSTWSRTTDAHTGSFAEHVDVTSYTSGAVRLLSQQDLGYCAPTAVPGHVYKLSAWYKGTARPRLVAFVRNGVGGWSVLGQSDRLSKSSSWKHGSWTTPALPSNETGVGIGVALESVGSLTMDDLAVSDIASP
jgi:Polysaccharide deacetylase